MQIIVFDGEFIEQAHTLSKRTGIELHQGNWKPEEGKAYIIFGAHIQSYALIHSINEFKLTYIIVNSLDPKHLPDEYKELLQHSYILEEDLIRLNQFVDEGYSNVEFYLNESYYDDKADEERKVKYITSKKNAKSVPPKKGEKIVYLDPDVNYSVNQLTMMYSNAEIYLSIGENDWKNINKALSSRCKVLSTSKNVSMRSMYKSFVKFQDELNLDPEMLTEDLKIPDYEKFLEHNVTYALNKSIPLIKNVYIKTEGTRKEEHVTISQGKDEEGRDFVEINPKDKTV